MGILLEKAIDILCKKIFDKSKRFDKIIYAYLSKKYNLITKKLIIILFF
jgi:hypothetical protein